MFLKRRILNDPNFQQAFERGKQAIALIKSFNVKNRIHITSVDSKHNAGKDVYIWYQIDKEYLRLSGMIRDFEAFRKTERGTATYYEVFNEKVNALCQELLGKEHCSEKLARLKKLLLFDPVDVVFDCITDDVSEYVVDVHFGLKTQVFEGGFFDKYTVGADLAWKRIDLLEEELNKIIDEIPPMRFGIEKQRQMGAGAQTKTTSQPYRTASAQSGSRSSQPANATAQTYNRCVLDGRKLPDNCPSCGGKITYTYDGIFTHGKCNTCKAYYSCFGRR
ncbi:MAG: hypothetical protein E7648_03480 [Ruminococcaceae bacterium]|nr:hypothetical protein [Oscillospiraceae bacterium]